MQRKTPKTTGFRRPEIAPAIQNIPLHTELGGEIRRAHKPERGFFAVDYGYFERLIAARMAISVLLVWLFGLSGCLGPMDRVEREEHAQRLLAPIGPVDGFSCEHPEMSKDESSCTALVRGVGVLIVECRSQCRITMIVPDRHRLNAEAPE